MIKEIAYQYHNLPIPGGGYATGFLFHKQKPDVLYLRTDIGGTYRYDYQTSTWKSLMESVTMFDLSESYPVALALDEQKPEKLYMISGIGDREHGKFSVSNDYGASFLHREPPFYAHGNWNGRGTGLRMVKDKTGKLYYASQKNGLYCTLDEGITWNRLPIEEQYMTMVWVSPDGNTIVAGTAGVTTGSEQMRGHSLYVSYNAGTSFQKLNMPESIKISGCRLDGYVAQRYYFDGIYLYITLATTGARSYVIENGYSCDSGDTLGGRVIRYQMLPDGKLGNYEDITPQGLEEQEAYSFGFSGISSCPLAPGMLVVSSICKDDGDVLLLSMDYGKSWKTILYDLEIGNIQFQTSYMKPQYNGNHSILHWMSDVKINPFNPDEVWFNSGTGVFVSRNLMSEQRSFTDCCKGLEETVHLNVYSLPEGPVQVIDIVGDLGGFAFEKLDQPCENSFADEMGNRYITCINADFCDSQPQTVIVTARGNWTGKTKGGLILSRDYGKTFQRLPAPYGISTYLDERLAAIETPNVNAGWVAISSDAQSIVWCVAEGIDLYMKGVVVSNDGGKTFEKGRIYNDTEEITNQQLHIKVFSDRMNPQIFYGFADEFQVYVSQDSGRNFYLLAGQMPPSQAVFGLIDCANKTEVRGEAGKEGVFYIALGQEGLWKLSIDLTEKQAAAVRLTPEKEAVYRVGLGLQSPEGDYMSQDKAIYICGTLEDSYGFYRSLTQGKTWEKINSQEQMFGDINSIDGDCRTFGRFYIATGSLGVKYGETGENTKM